MMDDNEHHKRTGRELFADYSAVAERVGVRTHARGCTSCVRAPFVDAALPLCASFHQVYGPDDYCDIMQHLNDRWAIASKSVKSGEAAEAQEFLMKQPERIRKLAAFATKKKKAATAKVGAVHENFSWIFGRAVEV